MKYLLLLSGGRWVLFQLLVSTKVYSLRALVDIPFVKIILCWPLGEINLQKAANCIFQIWKKKKEINDYHWQFVFSVFSSLKSSQNSTKHFIYHFKKEISRKSISSNDQCNCYTNDWNDKSVPQLMLQTGSRDCAQLQTDVCREILKTNTK